MDEATAVAVAVIMAAAAMVNAQRRRVPVLVACWTHVGVGYLEFRASA